MGIKEYTHHDEKKNFLKKNIRYLRKKYNFFKEILFSHLNTFLRERSYPSILKIFKSHLEKKKKPDNSPKKIN